MSRRTPTPPCPERDETTRACSDAGKSVQKGPSRIREALVGGSTGSHAAVMLWEGYTASRHSPIRLATQRVPAIDRLVSHQSHMSHHAGATTTHTGDVFPSAWSGVPRLVEFPWTSSVTYDSVSANPDDPPCRLGSESVHRTHQGKPPGLRHRPASRNPRRLVCILKSRQSRLIASGRSGFTTSVAVYAMKLQTRGSSVQHGCHPRTHRRVLPTRLRKALTHLRDGVEAQRGVSGRDTGAPPLLGERHHPQSASAPCGGKRRPDQARLSGNLQVVRQWQVSLSQRRGAHAGVPAPTLPRHEALRDLRLPGSVPGVSADLVRGCAHARRP